MVTRSCGEVNRLLDPTSLPEDLRRAMVAIKQVMLDGQRVWEVKFADKQKAIDSLGRYLVKTLNDYKSGARIDEHIWSKMSLRAKALSDQGIEDIAVYFAAQKRY